MRHGDKVNNLGRKSAHRKALMSNMASQLFMHKHIITTLAKARSLRSYAEPLITRGKEDSTANRRLVFSYLQDKVATTELFTVIGDKVAGRPGGYTRIIKMPRRHGDAAEMAFIELVDFNETYKKDGEQAAKKTRRSRRGSGSGAGSATAAATPTPGTAADGNDTAAAASAAEADMATDETLGTSDDAAANADITGNAPDAVNESPVNEDPTPAEENGTANEIPENA